MAAAAAANVNGIWIVVAAAFRHVSFVEKTIVVVAVALFFASFPKSTASLHRDHQRTKFQVRYPRRVAEGMQQWIALLCLDPSNRIVDCARSVSVDPLRRRKRCY